MCDISKIAVYIIMLVEYSSLTGSKVKLKSYAHKIAKLGYTFSYYRYQALHEISQASTYYLFTFYTCPVNMHCTILTAQTDYKARDV